ncbi:adenylyl-sulfate kinase [Aliiglaciecola sp. 3_MG-2023]|uniref:adenylyl-sulfate kinase n=1 Tax=Aliiglaciecola sp. 3_MG-2023 TaxID=3062644 RepID=UPI0026E428D4|nr:adenylyl-sulfate kinase [Aliiglaciecola sp. 3_MG-2023]MDO6695577.1 adenylyl-sulfate kinase [Aliiglaciecola sp. 3_MG-2023]
MATNIVWHQHEVDKKRRAEAKAQKPSVIWLTGLSGSGKSTIANLLEKKLAEASKHTYLLDGDNVRHGLCGDLGFSDSDRVENIRRISEVAKLFVDSGLIVLTAFISPFKADRDFCRGLLSEGEFIEVFVDTPIEVCEQRDPKGLYQKARQGDIKDFTGIDSAYETPENPEIHLTYSGQTAEESAELLFKMLQEKGFLD